MLSLSPAKMLVILVIALVVLGPEKLPQVARQVGAAWHELRQWRSRLESEVRGTFPNLPPTHEVAEAVRSPLAFLDRLADEHERAAGGDTTETSLPATTADAPGMGPAPPSVGAAPSAVEAAIVPPPGAGSVAHNGSVGGNGSSAGASSGTEAAPGADAAARRGFPVVPDDPSMN